MKPRDWADAGVEAPVHGPPVVDLREAMVWIRFAYVTGYTDALSGRNGIIDPCAAERDLTLRLPEG